MTERLSSEHVSGALAQLTGWRIAPAGAAIEKNLSFDDFAGALAYVSAVGALAEEADHHPDVEFGWGRAKITLSTHSAGGITQKDVELAQKIDAVEGGRVI